MSPEYTKVFLKFKSHEYINKVIIIRWLYILL